MTEMLLRLVRHPWSVGLGARLYLHASGMAMFGPMVGIKVPLLSSLVHMVFCFEPCPSQELVELSELK